MIAEYEEMLDEISVKLSPDNHSIAVALAALPEQIRGFGHVKEAAIARIDIERADLFSSFVTAPHGVLQGKAAE